MRCAIESDSTISEKRWEDSHNSLDEQWAQEVAIGNALQRFESAPKTNICISLAQCLCAISAQSELVAHARSR